VFAGGEAKRGAVVNQNTLWLLREAGERGGGRSVGCMGGVFFFLVLGFCFCFCVLFVFFFFFFGVVFFIGFGLFFFFVGVVGCCFGVGLVLFLLVFLFVFWGLFFWCFWV